MNQLFLKNYAKKITNIYYKIFSIKEIEESYILQLLFYVISISFLATFYGWMNSFAITVQNVLNGGHICPPYFLSCGEYYFLQSLPFGYSQGMFYVGLFLLILYGVWSASNKKWIQAHLVIFICLLWKIIWGFFLTYGLLGNFDYYDMTLAFIWLFLIHKEFFAKVAFVWLYFLASTVKIHEGWILGNYFNTLYSGAPIFGFTNLPIVTNFVIFMQIVGAWFLFSKNRFLYWFTFLFFLAFHIYSGFIVNYRYIIVSIPALFVLFGVGRVFLQTTNQNWKLLSINKKSILGYLFLFILLCGQMIAILIPGDQKKTLEGNYYGMFMFEAAHQCYSKANVFFKDLNESKNIFQENDIANNRCDPYHYFFPLKTLCDRGVFSGREIDRISWQFDHSINGHPFERLVNVGNVCDLDYSPLSHNSWIKIDSSQDLQSISDTENIPVYKIGYLNKLPNSIQILANPTENKVFLDLATKIYWFMWSIILFSLIAMVLHKNFKDRD